MQPMAFKTLDMAKSGPYLHDSRYWAEQKMDGTRALIRVAPDGDVRITGRHGRTLTHSAATQHLPRIVASLPRADGFDVTFDGEIMIDSGVFMVFDLPSAQLAGGVAVDPSETYASRRAVLASLFASGSPGRFATLVPTRHGTAGKLRLLDSVERLGGEGVMLKRWDAPYEAGKRSDAGLKVKFTRTADVVVTAVNRPDARHGSIAFGLFDEKLNLAPLGSCSAIGKPEVRSGDVIEVAYLAWNPGGALREPRMVRVREDKLAAECTLDQLSPYSKQAVL